MLASVMSRQSPLRLYAPSIVMRYNREKEEVEEASREEDYWWCLCFTAVGFCVDKHEEGAEQIEPC